MLISAYMQPVGNEVTLPKRHDDTVPAWRERPAHMTPATWRAAKFISLLSNPMVISLPCFAAVSMKATLEWRERLRWWSIATGAMSLTPLVHIRWGVSTGRFSDHEITVRQERFWPYMAELSAVGCAYLAMRSLKAPRIMIAMVVSVATGMAIITGVTLFWKMSMHVSGAAGTVTLVVLLYGKQWIPLFLVLPVVGWSRYVLDHHTVAQAAAGAAIGALAPLVVFRMMRPDSVDAVDEG
jgi:hypothetical protein